MTPLPRFLTLFFVVSLFCGCVEQADVKPASDGTVSVKLALNWYPEVEHGGFIAAETLGLYEAQKLDVELVPGGPGAAAGDYRTGGRADPVRSLGCRQCREGSGIRIADRRGTGPATEFTALYYGP
ncbi:MAG: hypothetical protein R3C17_21195 [Planctomycetaceae bacterium]